MKQLLLIPQRLPGINDMTGCVNKWVYSKLKAETEEMIGIEIRKQKLKPMKFAYVSFIWYEPNMKRDPDNICGGGQKFVMDALVNCKILPNDGWEQVLGLQHQFVRAEKASVQVTLSDKMEGQ